MDASKNLIWSILKNAASQAGGKIFLSLLRFVAALLIVRYLGEVRFGEYSLIITMLVVTEWFVDFGMTDITVRTIARDPGRQDQLLRSLAAAKVLQIVLGPCLLLGAIVALGYDAHMVRAAAIAGVGAVLYGGILLMRVLYRVRMRMERDVAAEVLGVVVMIPLLWIACVRDAPLEVLVACWVFSRLVFLVASVLFAHPRGSTVPRWSKGDLVWLIRAAAPLGVAGLLVSIYNMVDLLMLSQLASLRATGLFAGAQRFIYPVIFISDGLSAALFPVLASFWNRRPEDFRQTLQHSMNVLMFVVTGALCVLQAAPALLLGLLGPDMVEAELTLRLLACSLLLRAATGILAPLFVITGHQRHMFTLTAIALVAKLVLLTVLIPRFGIVGVAYTWLLLDLFVSFLPVLVITRRLVGFSLRWTVVPRALLAAGATIGLCYALGAIDSIVAIGVVAVAYPILSVALGAVSIGDIRKLVAAVRQKSPLGGSSIG